MEPRNLSLQGQCSSDYICCFTITQPWLNWIFYTNFPLKLKRVECYISLFRQTEKSIYKVTKIKFLQLISIIIEKETPIIYILNTSFQNWSFHFSVLLSVSLLRELCYCRVQTFHLQHFVDFPQEHLSVLCLNIHLNTNYTDAGMYSSVIMHNFLSYLKITGERELFETCQTSPGKKFVGFFVCYS